MGRGNTNRRRASQPAICNDPRHHADGRYPPHHPEPALVLVTTSDAASPRPHPTAKAKRTVDQFMRQAAGRSLAGIELSDLALQRSQSAAVRRLATRTKAEHAHTYETLLALATGPGSTTAPPETMDLEQRGIKSRLAGLSGVEFDRNYVAALRTNDERDIALYRSYATETDDAALKSWVGDQLVTIRKRRQLIESTALEVPGARP